MKFNAEQIAELINGEVSGNSNIEIKSLAKIEDAKEGDLSFLANPKYTPSLYTSKASIIIVNKSFIPKKNVNPTLIKVEDAYLSFNQLLELYSQMKFEKVGISKKADICSNSTIGNDVFIGAFSSINQGAIIEKNVKIYPNCYIGENVRIKEGSILFPGVKIYHNCIIGSNNIIHSGVVIGSDGFGFAANQDANYKKISQIGNVIIGDGVEIGSNSTIDRATIGSTRIGHGVKLDNLIQIAHNVEIGDHTVIAAQVGIAGSTKIGQYCMIGGQSAIAGHLNIADNVKIAGKSGIISSIKQKGRIVQGPIAFNIKDFQRSYVIFKKLPEMYKKLNKTKKKQNL